MNQTISFIVDSRNAMFEILRMISSNLDLEILEIKIADFSRLKDFFRALVRFSWILNPFRKLLYHLHR